METIPTTSSRIHPLTAGAAVSVILVSLLGVAAITGVLPNSHSSDNTPAAQHTGAPVLVQTAAGLQYMQPVSAPVTAPVATAYQVEPAQAQAPTPARQTSTTRHTTRTQQTPHTHSPTYAQADTGYRNDVRQPAYQQPAPAANSPIGIATGAVVGGLIGNQVGGGRGRALATVAGAVGGGYLGNMAGQKYGY